jgi:peptidoglycan hydrolase-like protein with peptidoglycan-binding domain
VVGASTREAIRAMQIKYGLPPDGYPSEELLNQLRNG